VFTNATLVREEHIELFRKYPPRDIEVTVYGASPETYERVTRRPGSFAAFSSGLNRLLESGVKVRLKAMALRSNFHELQAIAAFCRARTKDFSGSIRNCICGSTGMSGATRRSGGTPDARGDRRPGKPTKSGSPPCETVRHVDPGGVRPCGLRPSLHCGRGPAVSA
jgi:hypothetical protein